MGAASFGELHLELTRYQRLQSLLATRMYTYIHKYSSFLVVLISVGLAQTRPNYGTNWLQYGLNSLAWTTLFQVVSFCWWLHVYITMSINHAYCRQCVFCSCTQLA